MNLEKNLAAFENLTKPKAIIFDWDNTLVDTWPLIAEAIDTTMIAMNKEPWGLKKVRDNVHKSMRESFPEIFGDDWQKAGEIYKKTYRSINLSKIEFLPDSLELIKKIHQANIPQFIVSNKIGETLRAEAKKLQIDDYFFSLIGAHDADFDKPSKAPVELALIGGGIDLKNDEIWFIGDTITDLDCAINCGVKPIIYGFRDEENKEQISQTISEEIMAKKILNDHIAVYFDHHQLTKKLTNLINQ
jgi:phosphoglycolate phosphatase